MKARLFFLIASVPLAGCHFGTGFTHIAPSIGSKTSSPNEDFMYLDLNETYYDNRGVEPPLYELNTTEEADDSARRDSVSNCEILYDEDEPAAPELICVLDYMEEEFLTYDLSFVLNVPKGMCAHLHSMPSWHYNLPAGNGPPIIHHTIVPGVGEDAEDTHEYRLGNSSGTVCATSEEDLLSGCCNSYHHTIRGREFNCCLGEYAMTGDTISSDNPWGGDVRNCMGGPGRTNWSEYGGYDEDGFPAWLTEYVLEDGLRRIFDIPHLIQVARGGCYNTPIDNYMERFDQPVKELMADWPEYPTFLDQENGLPAASPFYTFECRDSAGGILHRINLMIREWNTAEEFMSHYESGGDDDSADPDVKGEEGDDCQYEERLPIRRDCLSLLDDCTTCCNDYLDLEDTLELGADYPNARYTN